MVQGINARHRVNAVSGRAKTGRSKKDGLSVPKGTSAESKEELESILNKLKYLHQEVEFLKK